jgi:hypothetical protein
MKIVGLSALRTSRLYPKEIFLVLISVRGFFVLQDLPDYGPIICSKHVCFIHISFVHRGGFSLQRDAADILIIVQDFMLKILQVFGQ